MELPVAKITPWFNNKTAAAAITFDDWTPGQIHIAVPVMAEFNFVGTYFVTLSNFEMRPLYDHWKLLRDVIASGNEVGNHTINHKDLTLLSHKERMHEIYQSQKILSLNLNTLVNTFAYPYGRQNNEVLEDVQYGHIGARSFLDKPVIGKSFYENNSYDSLKTEQDYYRCNDLSVSKDLSVAEVENIFSTVVSLGGYISLVCHGIYNEEFPKDVELYEAIDEQHFRNILTCVKNQEKNMWITTFRNIVLYHRTVKDFSIELTNSHFYGKTPTSFVLAHLEYRLTCNKKTFNAYNPLLTIHLILEDNCRCVAAEQRNLDLEYTQDGNELLINVKTIDSLIYINVEMMK